MNNELGMGVGADAKLTANTNVKADFAFHNTYHFECYDKDGNLKWEETANNLVTTEGLNSVLDVYFDAATQITSWYVGLKDTGTIAAGDTLASHAGWAELDLISGTNRVGPLTFAEPSAGSLSATAAAFTIDTPDTVYGAFLTSAQSGTTGVLYGAVDFGTARAVSSGDTLNVTVTVTAASA